MDGDTLILIEGGLIFGGVLAFGFWQLYSLRREKRRDAERKDREGRD